ncbi:MAG: PAS domain S-box protein [Deltaproteobacteria bacterium]|nr:PAS domain S-box protein [Deltaproteobacteria bacterium]
MVVWDCNPRARVRFTKEVLVADVGRGKCFEVSDKLSQLECIVENARQGIAVIQDRMIRFANPWLSRKSGYSPGELLQLDILDLVHPDDRSLVLRQHQGRLADRLVPERYEFRGLTKEGLGIWLEVSGTVIDWDGRPATLNFFTEITERKQAEEALLASERKWHHVIEDAPQIGVTIDPQGRILFANRHLLELTGWTAGEVLGRDWFEIFVPEDIRDRIQNVFRQVMARKHTHGFSRYENDIVTRAGERLIISWANVLTLDAGGFPQDVTCLGIDLTERTRATDRLQSSEERYRRLVETSKDAIFVVDENWQFVDVNAEACWATGRSRKELLTLGIEDVDVNFQKDAAAEFWRDREDSEAVLFESVHRRADGTTYPVEVNAVSFALDGRRFFFGQARDISSRLEAEVQSRRILDTAFDGFWLVGMDGRILRVNRAASDMLGYEMEELCRLQVWDVDHADNRDGFEGRMRAVEESGGLCFETRHRRKDGGLVDVQVSARWMDHDGGKAVCFLHDITEAKRLAERMRLLAEMVDLAPCSITVHDYDGRFLYANERTFDMHGYGRDEFMAVNLHELDVPESEEKLAERFRKIEETGEDTFEVGHFRKDGSVFRLEVTAKKVLWGDTPAVLSVAADITDRKRAEEAIQQAREKAEKANRSKSVFLANMSHDLRTPLNGILGMLQLLQTTRVDREQEEYLQAAAQASGKLTQLLSDILDISKAEAGRIEIQSEPLDLEELIDQVCGLFRIGAEEKGIDLRRYLHPGVPRQVMGDGARLQQVLNNLVGNALKFTGQGSIAIEVYPLPTVTSGTCRVLFSVIDTGIGIPDDKIDFLFKPFTQLGEGYQRQFQGVGLGLSICKRLVELMDGHISLESQAGEGTTIHFCVTFGQVEPTIGPSPVRGTDSTATGPHLRILLAEDEPVNRLAASMLLEKSGHTVATVEDGRQALEALKEGTFDLVLMDIQMPVMDGVEATRAIRAGLAGARNVEMPVVAMTAYAMSGDRESFMAAGITEYLAKPVTREAMDRMLDKLFGQGAEG